MREATELIAALREHVVGARDTAAELAAVVSRLAVEHEGRGVEIGILRAALDEKINEVARLKNALDERGWGADA